MHNNFIIAVLITHYKYMSPLHDNLATRSHNVDTNNDLFKRGILKKHNNTFYVFIYEFEFYPLVTFVPC